MEPILLSISTKTVETYRAMALRKLNLDTTAALIRYTIRNNIVGLRQTSETRIR